jgi:hypothetical protein
VPTGASGSMLIGFLVMTFLTSMSVPPRSPGLDVVGAALRGACQVPERMARGAGLNATCRGTFLRSLSLPAAVDTDKAKADKGQEMEVKAA